MMRWTKVIACVALMGPTPNFGWAQDGSQTLADIRQELSVLYVEIQKLKRELSTTGSPGGVSGGSTLTRLDAIEGEMQRLTSSTELLEQRINRVVADGTNQIGDLEFRLCELEPKCDLGALKQGSTLGGGAVAVAQPVARPSSNPELAIGEQADFEQADATLSNASYQQASEQFQAFLDVYPGSPLTPLAHIRRGDALAGMDNRTGSARAYLDGFSAAPTGSDAPEALYKLGRSLGELGQTSEACVTLSEVGARFPGGSWVGEAETERARLGCS